VSTCAYHYWPAPTAPAITFQDLLAWHDGCCAFCGKRVAALIVDHDHDAGVVRGLLCGGCNIREAAMTTSDAASWVDYRANPPAKILALSIKYKGGIESYLPPRAYTPTGNVTLDDLAGLGLAYRESRAELDASHIALLAVIRDAAGTTSELQIAKATGVSRQTVRKALGK
jgi:Recombination endonuclease VII